MTLRQWVSLGLSLVAAVILSLSVIPFLPWWLAPPLILLVVIGAAIDGELAVSNAAAIWGGLVFDLLSPGPFGVRWLALLVVALLTQESRRFVAIRDLPWLWPIWFGLAALVAHLPLAFITHQLLVAARSSLAAALWGSLGLVTLHWISESRRGK